MATNRQKANRNYYEKTESINVRFTQSEIDLYNFVKAVPNTNGYMKMLIRLAKDMHNSPEASFE